MGPHNDARLEPGVVVLTRKRETEVLVSESNQDGTTLGLLHSVRNDNIVVRESLRTLLWQVEDALTACARIDAAVAEVAQRSLEL